VGRSAFLSLQALVGCKLAIVSRREQGVPWLLTSSSEIQSSCGGCGCGGGGAGMGLVGLRLWWYTLDSSKAVGRPLERGNFFLADGDGVIRSMTIVLDIFTEGYEQVRRFG